MVHQPASAEEFKETVKKGIVIVDFSATWCGPCKMISPHFDDLAKKFPQLKFIKVDVDELEDVSSEAGISAMPSFFVYRDGQIIDQVIGANREKLDNMVKKYADSLNF